MSQRDRYTLTQVSMVQKQALDSERVMRKARKLIEKAEAELAKAEGRFRRAYDRYIEAKDELDALGVKPTTKGFSVDKDGYVVPKRHLRLVT